MISDKLSHFFGVSPDNATDEQYYKSIALIVRDEIAEKNSDFRHVADGQDSKKVYYLCMEFLMGRSLKIIFIIWDLQKFLKKLSKATA